MRYLHDHIKIVAINYQKWSAGIALGTCCEPDQNSRLLPIGHQQRTNYRDYQMQLSRKRCAFLWPWVPPKCCLHSTRTYHSIQKHSILQELRIRIRLFPTHLFFEVRASLSRYALFRCHTTQALPLQLLNFPPTFTRRYLVIRGLNHANVLYRSLQTVFFPIQYKRWWTKILICFFF